MQTFPRMAVQRAEVQSKGPGPGVSAHRLEPRFEDSTSYGKVALILAYYVGNATKSTVWLKQKTEAIDELEGAIVNFERISGVLQRTKPDEVI